MPASLTRPSRLLAALAGLALVALPAGASGAETDPTYAALRAARPDGRILRVDKPLALERDAFRFQFDAGAFHFLGPVAGRTPGAVFIGEGSYRLSPATEDERRHLAFVTGQADLEVLADRFERLVLLFADDTEAELSLAAPVEQASPDGAATQALEQALGWQREDFKTNLHLRLLQDLLDTPGLTSGVFMALVDGNDHPPALAAVDPRGAEALRLAPLLGGEDTFFFVADEERGGFWYLCDQAGEIRTGRRPPYRARLDALHYQVETEIQGDEELVGTTTIRLRAEAPARVVPLNLVSTLRLQEAAYRPAGSEAWTPVPFIQEQKQEDADAAVVLPELLPKGGEVELRLSYRGNGVLFDLGLDVFAVGARESWYPNLGVFRDLATFDLTYRVPKGEEVVSVGEQVSSTIEGDDHVSAWRAGQPIRVAAFGFGPAPGLILGDAVTGVELRAALRQPGMSRGAGRAPGPEPPGFTWRYERQGQNTTRAGSEMVAVQVPGPGGGGGSLGRQVLRPSPYIDLAPMLDAVRVGTAYFGPLDQPYLTVLEVGGEPGHASWPTLVGASWRSPAGFRSVYDLLFQPPLLSFPALHSLGHQWWGQRVGCASYRDRWLSEGLAELLGALVLQHTEGWEQYLRFLEDRRDALLAEVPGAPLPAQAGPLARGFRLNTARSRGVDAVILPGKGGLVLHMLRMMMWDSASLQSDARFAAMMKDFTKTYAGKDPTTEDFKLMVEEHMVPAMDAAGDGTMDWFFDQWVYGTEIPRLTAELQASKVGGGEYRITGEVTVSEVSEAFRVPVPLYADLGKDGLAVFGRLPFIGSGTQQVDMVVRLPEKPKRILANARLDFLVRE